MIQRAGKRYPRRQHPGRAAAAAILVMAAFGVLVAERVVREPPARPRSLADLRSLAVGAVPTTRDRPDGSPDGSLASWADDGGPLDR